MAPTQSTYDVKISAQGVNCRHCGGSKRSRETLLPISRRGRFFQDSFFSGITRDFDATVRKVLDAWDTTEFNLTDRWDDMDLGHSDVLNRYRQLRSRDLQEDNQAIVVASDNTSHKIVVDVHDFLDGSVKVKVVGERELVVEGRMEKSEGGSLGSSLSSHTFTRRFSLSDHTDMNAITSVMSSDGILTITAPKLGNAVQGGSNIHIKVDRAKDTAEDKLSNTAMASDKIETEIYDKESNSEQEDCDCSDCRLSESQDNAENKQETKNVDIKQEFRDTETKQEFRIPIKIFGSESIAESKKFETISNDSFQQKANGKSQIQSETKTLEKNKCEEMQEIKKTENKQEFRIPIKILRSESTAESNKLETISNGSFQQEANGKSQTQSETKTLKKEKCEEMQENKQEFRIPIKIFGSESNKPERISNGSCQQEANVKSQTKSETKTLKKEKCEEMQENKKIQNEVYENVQKTDHSFLPVTRRGQFFSDSFFRDSWVDFDQAVQDVVAAWGASSSDHLTSYRNLRTRDLRENNQAVTTSEDEHQHKFVLDVKDFVDGGEVDVKVSDDREFIIEGRVDKQEGGSKSTKRFRRLFLLPENIQADAVTSAMSSDGVLTITAPKKKPSITIRELDIPVSIGSRNETVHDSSMKESSFTKHSDYTTHGSKVSSAKQESCESSGMHECRDPFTQENCESSKGRESSAMSNSRVSSFVQESHESSNNRNSSTMRDSQAPSLLQENNESSSVQDYRPPSLMQEKCDSSALRDRRSSSVGSSRLLSFIQDTQESMAASPRASPVDTTRLAEHVIPIHVETADHSKNVTFDLNEEDLDSTSHRVLRCHDRERHGASMDKELRRNFSGEKKVEQHLSSDFKRRYLPIVRKGCFSEDSYFDGLHDGYAGAVREVLEKAREWSCRSDALENYRGLRRRHLKLDNQAVSMSEDEQHHRIVVDVHDFTGGDVSVKLMSERELVVEGQAEKQEGTQVSKVSFVRGFMLPCVDLNTITAALSSDGVLTIISTKITDDHHMSHENAWGCSDEVTSRRDSFKGLSYVARS